MSTSQTPGTTACHLLELAAQPEILAIDFRELFRRGVYILEIPLELVLELVRADDDIDLQQSPT